MVFPDETYDDLISLDCLRSYHMLRPHGPGSMQVVTLSIIYFETWSGKPEPNNAIILNMMDMQQCCIQILSGMSAVKCIK